MHLQDSQFYHVFMFVMAILDSLKRVNELILLPETEVDALTRDHKAALDIKDDSSIGKILFTNKKRCSR